MNILHKVTIIEHTHEMVRFRVDYTKTKLWFIFFYSKRDSTVFIARTINGKPTEPCLSVDMQDIRVMLGEDLADLALIQAHLQLERYEKENQKPVIRKANITLSQCLKILKELDYIDEIPEVLQEDFKKFLMDGGHTCSVVNGRSVTHDMQKYIYKLINVGVDYPVQWVKESDATP